MVKLESKKKKKMEGNKETRLAIEAKWLLLREPLLPAPTGRRTKDVWERTVAKNEAAILVKSDRVDRLLAVWPEARRSSAPLFENRALNNKGHFTFQTPTSAAEKNTSGSTDIRNYVNTDKGSLLSRPEMIECVTDVVVQ